MQYERLWSVKSWRLSLLTAIVLIQCVNTSEVTAAENPQASGAERSDPVELTSCSIPGVEQTARCGSLEVPENPARPDGRRLSIGVVVIPATDGPASPDPIVPLMGGPGEDAISAAALFAAQFEELRGNRDLLLVDQRGTGQSNALRCSLHATARPELSLRDLFPVSTVNECRQELRARADLTQYSYLNFANDLEHVRRALGYGPLNLFAGSYGTRAAQVYVRAYEQSVRTVYLGSVIPMDVPTPLTMPKTSQTVFEDTFGACEADAECRAAFPNLRDEFREVLARLESGRVRVTVPDRTESVPMSRGRVVEWFRARLYRPKSAAILPWLIHQAHEGNWDPIVDGILSQARDLDSEISLGLFFSVTCSEDMAFVHEDDIVAEAKDTFLGDYRLRQQKAACKEWPKVSPPEGYRKPVRSSVPALFVSGDSDGGSPLWFTERVAPGFENRLEVVHRGRGHTEWSKCVGELYRHFVRRGTVRGLDASSCERPAPRPPFKTSQTNAPPSTAESWILPQRWTLGDSAS